ncbi:MAG: hypothetical protein COV75_08380 [Candidatus Omnitrophica bacterium CG11_big_fil_rev_8_21_14_0_20_63_9]|nr:MAG: hypothetical protein COV75_08380 [Candidatus Omnitrophica bacterium CG11_big_fil_rev_8_21_14_0_20_63_9]
MSRIRLVHIIDNLGRGGAQRQLVELLKGLPRDRYELHVISMSTEKLDYAQTIRKLGVPLTCIPQSGLWSWRTFGEVVGTLRALRPTIVQTWLFTSDLYGRLAARRVDAPVIISTVRSVEPDKPRRRVWADRWLKRWTDAFIVNAQAVGEVLRRRERVSAECIHTIYNGLDLEVFNPARVDGAARRALSLGPSTPAIGIVGRFAPVKDHATFLRAAAIVQRQAPSAQFMLIGNGPLSDSLKQLCQTLRLERHVRFVNNQDDVAEYIAALDAVVVTSLYEGCCNVILEGMAMGKPVIATAVGGNPELVTAGRTGWLVPPRSPEHLAEAILQMIRQPQQARTMGQAGRARIEAEFTLSRMVEQTEGLYRALLERKAVSQ